MKTDMDGLILKDLTVGDKDRIITVLTKEKGIISCYVKNALVVKHHTFAATKPLTYARLCVYRNRGMYIVDQAETIKSFYNFTMSVEQFALSQYMCGLAIETTPAEIESDGQLELLLNCLHTLVNGLKTNELIKAVFEVRLSVITGNMPNVIYCAECGCYDSAVMYFDPSANTLMCGNCCRNEENFCTLSKGALTAMRYIVTADPKKIFSFRISQESMSQLARCAELYMTNIVGKTLKTLDYYNFVSTM